MPDSLLSPILNFILIYHWYSLLVKCISDSRFLSVFLVELGAEIIDHRGILDRALLHRHSHCAEVDLTISKTSAPTLILCLPMFRGGRILVPSGIRLPIGLMPATPCWLHLHHGLRRHPS